MSAPLQILATLSQEQENATKAYEREVDAWWEALPMEEREKAFYAVVKRIYDNEIASQSSYRYILYDVFGFGPSMYGMGMDCGFMSLHNAIKTDEEENILAEYRNKRSAI